MCLFRSVRTAVDRQVAAITLEALLAVYKTPGKPGGVSASDIAHQVASGRVASPRRPWHIMRPRYFLFSIPLTLFIAILLSAQSRSVFRTRVDLVEVSFVVTDDSGKYVSGLRAADLRVLQDGSEQPIRSFLDADRADSEDPTAASIYVLFDTSNPTYATFPQTEDAIAAFIRSVQPRDLIAINAFSRNLHRLSPLSADRNLTLHNLRDAVSGDQTALYNSILLTVLDAARSPGRKSIVVFSNGPDDASALSPEDVGRIAEREGVPIYMFSRGREDLATHEAMEALTTRTGGKLFWARSSAEQSQAFAAVRNDLEHTYLLTYSPMSNPNQGFHKIELQVPGREHCHFRSRTGYTVH
jgi:VWFA-related protein